MDTKISMTRPDQDWALSGEESSMESFLNGQNSTGTVSRVDFPDNNHKDLSL